MKILLLLPYGGLYGSEIYMLNIVNRLDPAEYQVAVFCKSHSGKNIEKNPNIHWVNSGHNPASFWHRAKNKIIRTLFGRSVDELRLLKLHKRFKPDIWYINTIVLSEYALLAAHMDQKYILQVHEMPSIYGIMKAEKFRKMVQGAEKVLVCSALLVDIFRKLGAASVHLLYGAIDSRITVQEEERTRLRKLHGIPEGAFVWGMAGSTSYRKGFDLFARVALHFKEQNVHFVWIGHIKDHGYEYYVKKLMASNKEKIHLTGKKNRDEFFEYLNMIDGFFLSSREDPFPLVMIEAAYLGKPVLAFDSGGVREFVKEGCGYVTEGINLKEMIGHMEKVMRGSGIDREKIKNNAKKYNLDTQLKNWRSIMEAE